MELNRYTKAPNQTTNPIANPLDTNKTNKFDFDFDSTFLYVSIVFFFFSTSPN